jgi:nucleoside-diphosphate-sugar epimerase
MKIYIIGINSFIGKSLYLGLRQQLNNKLDQIYCISHNELHLLKSANITSDDIVINFCGVNRAVTKDEYDVGNYHFLEKLVLNLNIESLPYLIHTSSYMVNGFNNNNNNLVNYTTMFIESKLAGENYLLNNYPLSKLCIIRPSNIYGELCEPYYNNILVTLIYESIIKDYKTTSINKNCVRNFLSINGLVSEIINIINCKKVGTFNIVSSNTVSLSVLIDILHNNNTNTNISVIDGESSVPNNQLISGELITVNEDLTNCINNIKTRMKKIIDLKKACITKTLSRLTQSRGDMVEISDLQSSRLYMITITQNSFRGNHYHDEQVEEFYVNKGKCLFLLAPHDDPTTVLVTVLNKYDSIKITPYVIHTLVNDFCQSNNCELFITSTQKYIPNCAVDTVYINILQ